MLPLFLGLGKLDKSIETASGPGNLPFQAKGAYNDDVMKRDLDGLPSVAYYGMGTTRIGSANERT
jgi:hypothetical protein